MRAVIVCGSVLFAAGSVLAQAEPPKFEKLTLAKVGELKPLDADAKDTPVVKLQKEAYNARLLQVQLQIKHFERGAVSRQEIGLGVRHLALLEADLFVHKTAGTRWFELWISLLTEEEDRARKLYQNGAATEDEMLLAAQMRIHGQLEFLRFQEKRNPDTAPDRAAKLKLFEERLKLLMRREERLKELAARGVISQSELLEARAARLEAEIELLKLKGM